ncbi:MAG: hypothetical protein M0Z41_19615 [Peptococcaceae bacterium]|nr:hypothetical protein [Peptococcaceae bacterium]
MLQSLISEVKRFLADGRGEISAMVWVVGAAVVVVLVIGAAMLFVPSSAQTIWTSLVGYITKSFDNF